MKPHRITLVAIFLLVWLSAIPNTFSLCPIAPGDVNGDLTVNAVDVQCGILTVLWSLSGKVGPAPVCVGETVDHADIDCDGDIVVTDVLLVISYVLTAPLPPGVDSNVNGCPDTCEAPCVLDPALCDDGNLCTVDSCAADSGCAHVPVDCNDGTPCTTDSCDPAVGCIHTNVIDGTLCNGDGDGCTHNDHCANGTCIVGNPPPCTDGLVCTIDNCVALGASGYTCVSTVYPGACFSGEVTTIDAPNYVSFSGCGPYFGTTAPGGLKCTGAGCANVCGIDHHLDYAVTTVPGDSYQVVVKVADYLHNCKDKLKMSVRIGGVTIGTFIGTGTNAWAFPTFSFVATSTTTVLAVTEDNDAGCKFNGTCSPTCVPLYNDLNMILDHIQVVRTTGGAPCNTCNDGNPCTVDGCNAQGECTNIPDDIVCDDGMACTLSHCDAVSGCINTPAFGFTVVYEVNFPENANWDSPADIPYSVDLAAGITKPFDRVGYLWELDGPDGNAFVWAVMDTFTDDPALLGVPVDWTWQIPVKNLTVQSNHPAIDNIVGHTDGNIEFWSNCYEPGPDGIFDAHDDIAAGAADCSGSMQLHAGGKTIFAYNGWSAQGAEVDDLGFGPNTGGVNPDWTGMQSAGGYTNRKLRIYIGSHESNGDVCVDDGVPCTVDVCSGVSGCSSVAADAPGSESQGQPGTPGTVLIDVATNPGGVPAGAPLSLAQKDAVLSCEPTETITAPDGSPITPIIEWTVNGQVVTSGPGLAATLGALGAATGDTVSCRLRTCDGSTKSFWSEAETPIQIIDAPLVVAPPTVLPVYVGEDFVCNAMANDPDGDWFSLAFVWEVTTAQEDGNVTTQLDTTSDTLSATYVADVFGRKSTVVCLTVVNTGTDTIIAASEPVEILNHPPTLSSVKLTGTKGGAYQVHPFVCTVGQAQDLDGDPVTVGILLYSGDLPWQEFSVLPGGTATSGPGPWVLGDEVSCTATPNDGFEAGATITDTATIVNHVPVCSAASVLPSGAPYPSGVNLTCACTSVVDYNGDTKGTSCKWTNWAGTDLGWTGCQRNTNDIPAGWAVFCNVAPTDGFGPGVSAPVLVTRAGSSPPTWDIPATGGVTLSPSVGITAVDVNTVFTCAYPPTAADPDGSGVTYTIDWSYKQGSVTYPLLTNDFNVASLTLKKLVTGALGASGVPKKNDSLFCRVHAKDGQVNSEIVKTSLSVVIADHPATFDVAQFPPAGGKGSQGIIFPGETFSCEAAIIDYDADTLLEVRIGTMNFPNNPLDFPALATTGPMSADYGLKTFVPMLNSPLVKQAIACNGIITFPPGAPAGTSTKMFSYELVMDAIPTVTATMVPENSTPCEFRYCVIDVYDDDAAVGYPIEGLAAEIRWEVDGTTVWNSTELLPMIDSDEAVFVIPASGLTVDDGAQIQCFATIHKGPQIKSAEAASPLGLVTGAAPTVESVELPGPLLAGEMATCNAGVIINDCSTQTTFAYRWVVNGAVVPGATGQQFSTFGIAAGATVECEARVIAAVGPASGPWTKSNPTILGVSLWTLVGPPDGGFAGVSVAVLTDVNGDQRDEVVIGAPQATHDGQTTAGRVYIAFGADPGPPLQLQNLLLGEGGIVFGGESGGWPPYQSICKEPTPLVNYPCKPGIPGISSSGSNLSPQGDAVGTRVRAIGDITGDGIDDLLVSAPYAFALGKYLNGRTYIVSGKDLSLLANSPPQSISYAAWLRIDGEQGLNVNAYMAASGLNNRFHNGHLAGFGLAAGDFTGDGVPDIAIGAPNFDSFEGDNGRVYMLDGLALAQKAPTKSLVEPVDPTDLDELSVWLGTLFAQDPNPLEPPLVGRVFDGPKNFGDSFTAQVGAVLNSMGDMNGDGKDEVLAGPWGLYPNSFILTWDHSPQADGVAVSLQTPSAPTVVKNVPGYFAFSLKPGQVLSEIVTSGRLTTWARAAIGGDINGDGLADLVAPAYENEGGKKQLEIAVIFGAPGLTQYDHNTADNGTGGFTIEGNTKEGKSDGFIDGVPAGDLDGDGLDEVAFIVRPIGTGAPKARLYVAWGKTDGTTVKLSDVENGIAGFTLNFPIDIWSTATGDVNGDGLGDLVIGIGGDFTNPPQNGFAEVHYGRDLRGLLTQRGDADGNVLLGSSAIDRIVGGRGDDILIGLGGADTLYGGPGNDRIEVSDADFVRVDGATGTDTLALGAGVDLDLTQTGSRVRGFEAIELGGGQTLTLTAGFVGRQSRSTSTLAITGTGTVDSAPAQLNSALWGNWYNEGAATWPEQDPMGVQVTVFRSGPTRLLVEQGIKTLLPPGFVNLVFEVGELQPNGTVVGNLDAVDADGYVVGLELVDGDPFGIFAFDPFTGSLVLVNATPLNFELRKFWTLTVKATDNDGLEREGEIVVRILDENEPPVFAATVGNYSVVEGAANGTIVAQVFASDPDQDDVVVYSMTPHEVFSLDPVSGLISVIDGGAIDFESGDGYPLTIIATDSLGLVAENDIVVQVTDVPNIEQTINLWFVTEKQSLSGPQEAFGFNVPPTSHTIDFDKGFLPQMPGGFQNLTSEFAVTGTVSGQIETTFGGEFGTGEVNAVLPVSVKIEFPDELTLGEPFVLTSSWTLLDLAQFWGKTTHVNFFMNQKYNNIAMKVQQFGETVVDVGPWSFDSSLSGKPFTYKVPAKSFQSVRFKDAFPDGVKIPEKLLELAELNENLDDYDLAFVPIPETSVYDDFWQVSTVAELQDAQELYEFFGESGVFQDNELMVTPEVTSSFYDGYIDLNDIIPDWLGLGIGLLKGNPTWATFDFQLDPIGYAHFIIELYRNFLTVKLKMRETFFLDIAKVTAIATFEDGTVVPFVVGEPIDVTLPETADINSDGKVEVAFEFSIDTLFTHWKVFRVSLLDTSRIGYLASKSYKYKYSATGAVIGKELIAEKEHGPLYESTWIYGYKDKPTEMDQWSLKGFNKPKAAGTVDLAQ